MIKDLEVFIKKLEKLDVEGLRGANNRVLLRTIEDAGEQVEVAYLGVSGHTQSIAEKKVVMLDRVLADSSCTDRRSIAGRCDQSGRWSRALNLCCSGGSNQGQKTWRQA
ncbi:MAG: hypothetical protein U5L96_07500 [Owenweeksia sp.]|nr:hypothetical protein [Owenweeksia sp.]